jgi:hypothetical protein
MQRTRFATSSRFLYGSNRGHDSITVFATIWPDIAVRALTVLIGGGAGAAAAWIAFARLGAVA